MMNLFERLAHLNQNLVNGAFGSNLGQSQALLLVLLVATLILWLPVGLFHWLERWAWNEETKSINQQNEFEMARAIAIENEQYDIEIEKENAERLAERLEEAARLGAYDGAYAAVVDAKQKDQK